MSPFAYKTARVQARTRHGCARVSRGQFTARCNHKAAAARERCSPQSAILPKPCCHWSSTVFTPNTYLILSEPETISTAFSQRWRQKPTSPLFIGLKICPRGPSASAGRGRLDGNLHGRTDPAPGGWRDLRWGYETPDFREVGQLRPRNRTSALGPSCWLFMLWAMNEFGTN